MTVENIINQCIAAGVALGLEGDNLKLTGDVKSLEPSLVEAIKNNKVLLISWLKEQQSKSTNQYDPFDQISGKTSL